MCSIFQMTKCSKKLAVKDFENTIFENEAGIQLAIICKLVISKFYFQKYRTVFKIFINVTVPTKTVLIGTFSITRKTNLKYSSCCGSVVLDFSHARFTV